MTMMMMRKYAVVTNCFIKSVLSVLVFVCFVMYIHHIFYPVFLSA